MDVETKRELARTARLLNEHSELTEELLDEDIESLESKLHEVENVIDDLGDERDYYRDSLTRLNNAIQEYKEGRIPEENLEREVRRLRDDLGDIESAATRNNYAVFNFSGVGAPELSQVVTRRRLLKGLGAAALGLDIVNGLKGDEDYDGGIVFDNGWDMDLWGALENKGFKNNNGGDKTPTSTPEESNDVGDYDWDSVALGLETNDADDSDFDVYFEDDDVINDIGDAYEESKIGDLQQLGKLIGDDVRKAEQSGQPQGRDFRLEFLDLEDRYGVNAGMVRLSDWSKAVHGYAVLEDAAYTEALDTAKEVRGR